MLLSVLPLLVQIEPTPVTVSQRWFIGRWAFEDAGCGEASDWQFRQDGSFKSENLDGQWRWDGEKLTLALIDLLEDEETGEIGERFELQGPVEKLGEGSFAMTIEPDRYVLKRCE